MIFISISIDTNLRACIDINRLVGIHLKIGEHMSEYMHLKLSKNINKYI